MHISEVKLYILENPDLPERALKLVEVPNLLRTQYTHQPSPGSGHARQHILEVSTDTGLRSRCTTTLQPHQAQILRLQVLGAAPKGHPLAARVALSEAAQGHALALSAAGLVWRF